MSLHLGYSLLTLFPGRVGGSESNVRGLLEQFADGNGPDQVTVLANRQVADSYAEYERGPVRLHHVRSYRAGDGDVTRALAMAAAVLRPERVARDVPDGLDVVHYPVTVPIPALGLPSVVTIYDVQHLELPRFFSRAERFLRRRTYDAAARGATAVVTTSEYTRGRLTELLGIDPGRIEVVPIGIDHDRFTPTVSEREEELLAEHELPERFVVYPANLWPHKNHARLVEALARAQDGELALVLTGQAYGRLDKLVARSAELGVADRVKHLGFVSRDAVPALYRRALALVFPSLYEGFGTPPLEAMACGCPVASSKAASLAEHTGDAVLPLGPEDPDSIAAAIDRVVGDAELRTRLREAGLRRAALYNWPEAAAAHTRIYERVRNLAAPL